MLELQFDSVPAEAQDPAQGLDTWGARSRWYDQRKRNLLLAGLPRRRFHTAFETGCADGELAATLAARCDTLLASDFSDTLLARAQRRLSRVANVKLEKRRLPEEWPQRRFELIVISELGYYLEPAELDQLVRCAKQALTHHGVLVACHWRHAIDQAPLDGDSVHRTFNRLLDLPRLLSHEEEDFRLEMWSADGQSVAMREGLA